MANIYDITASPLPYIMKRDRDVPALLLRLSVPMLPLPLVIHVLIVGRTIRFHKLRPETPLSVIIEPKITLKKVKVRHGVEDEGRGSVAPVIGITPVAKSIVQHCLVPEIL